MKLFVCSRRLVNSCEFTLVLSFPLNVVLCLCSIFFLYMFTMSVTMKAWFRALAAALKSEATAQALAGMSVLVFVLYTGYAIPQPSMIGALRWITYINVRLAIRVVCSALMLIPDFGVQPLRYGFEGILTNEFHTLNGVCSSLVPQGPGYENIGLANQVCTAVGSQAGQAFVNGNTFVKLSYGYSYSHVWRVCCSDLLPCS